MPTDEPDPPINPVVSAVLGLFAAPRLNMREDYRRVRLVQRLAAGPTGRFHTLDQSIRATDGHEIPVRVFLPKQRTHDDVLVFFHGGGWVVGNIDSYTPACAALADATGRLVLSVDYRLAPEHPFPQGFEDCLRVTDVLARSPQTLDLDDAGGITLIGDSAGGNLAAAVSLRLAERGCPMPSRQILLYPATWYDHDPLTSPYESVRTYGSGLRLTSTELRDYMALYQPDPEARRTPLIAPLLASDLSGQPSTLVVTAELDLLRDEGEAYAQRLQEAGTFVRLERLPGALHGFMTLPRFARPVVRLHELVNEFLEETDHAPRVTEHRSVP
ncbi:alpha/beta hydrolase [Aestuariimicrobium sp. T2.26MG-19.2B]|uniref:alpha/beta hydrolase n=1 Tax=Aestuariimicrobium sp. T2.26MG-19.2B TaxID=3040679 RepID=UPI002477BA03|nr:alpha/beta hydrolase [Aestuariimicrobium sp. T2.26MG-19.2B]CAI9401887.1 Acetyl esterase [Aestuariimicrobium sp. T2.26MG-19.2B]